MKRVDIFSKNYYTDSHDVDEDIRAIARLGGDHPGMSTWTGITFRLLTNSLTTAYAGVASRKK